MNWNNVKCGADEKGENYTGKGPYPDDGERVLCDIDHREGHYKMILEYSKFEDESNMPPFLDDGYAVDGVVAWTKITNQSTNENPVKNNEKEITVFHGEDCSKFFIGDELIQTFQRDGCGALEAIILLQKLGYKVCEEK